jgi:hypothetical protein
VRAQGVVASLLCALLAQLGCGKVASCPPDVDLLSSNDNCGVCGHACGAGEVCGNGACMAGCPQNQSQCGDTCSATDSDPLNCGGCGTACIAGDVCVDSQC